MTELRPSAASHSLYSECGIVHGDIAPANLLWREVDGEVRGVLNDFDHHRSEDIRSTGRKSDEENLNDPNARCVPDAEDQQDTGVLEAD